MRAHRHRRKPRGAAYRETALRNELYDRHPELISAWQSLRDARASARAIRWLVEQGLLEDETARRFTDDHPEPVLP